MESEVGRTPIRTGAVAVLGACNPKPVLPLSECGRCRHRNTECCCVLLVEHREKPALHRIARSEGLKDDEQESVHCEKHHSTQREAGHDCASPLAQYRRADLVRCVHVRDCALGVKRAASSAALAAYRHAGIRRPPGNPRRVQPRASRPPGNWCLLAISAGRMPGSGTAPGGGEAPARAGQTWADCHKELGRAPRDGSWDPPAPIPDDR